MSDAPSVTKAAVLQFPSDAFLERKYGTKAVLNKKVVKEKNRLLFWHNAMAVYNDVTLADAFASGELRRSWNPLRYLFGFSFVVDTEVHFRRNDPFTVIRQNYQEKLHVWPRILMRRNIDVYHEGSARTIERMYIFRDRLFSAEVMLGVEDGFGVHVIEMCTEAEQRALFTDLATLVAAGGVRDQTMWSTVASDSDIWLEPSSDAFKRKTRKSEGQQWQKATLRKR